MPATIGEYVPMKRLLLALSLAAAPLAASAEWIEIGASADEVFYMDGSSLRRDGGSAQVWLLADMHVPEQLPQGQWYQSHRTLWQVDCDQDRVKRVRRTLHFGKMGVGDAVAPPSSEGEWLPAPTGTLMALVVGLACSATG